VKVIFFTSNERRLPLQKRAVNGTQDIYRIKNTLNKEEKRRGARKEEKS
jgi:hypothetical protein